MLLPVGTNMELFSHPPPLFPTSRLYNIRPFQLKDKVSMCSQTDFGHCAKVQSRSYSCC